MDTKNIIRAWKDEEYRLSLSAAERTLLPDHPAGFIELTDAEMGHVAGGRLGAAGDTPLGICDEVTPGDPCGITPKCPSSDWGCIPLPQPEPGIRRFLRLRLR